MLSCKTAICRSTLSTLTSLSVDCVNLDEFDAQRSAEHQTRTAMVQIKSVIRQKNAATAQAKSRFWRLCPRCVHQKNA